MQTKQNKNNTKHLKIIETQKTNLKKQKLLLSLARRKTANANQRLIKLNKIRKQIERQEKKKKIEGPEIDEVQITFLKKLRSFFCFCTAIKNKNNSTLNKLNYGKERSKNETQNPVMSSTTDERDNLTDKPQKTFLEKMKLFICFCTKKNKSNSSPRNNHAIKKLKNEIQSQDKSLRTFIKQNWKWVISLLVVYIIISGAVVSVPILVNHFRVMNRNETEQERSII